MRPSPASASGARTAGRNAAVRGLSPCRDKPKRGNNIIGCSALRTKGVFAASKEYGAPAKLHSTAPPMRRSVPEVRRTLTLHATHALPLTTELSPLSPSPSLPLSSSLSLTFLFVSPSLSLSPQGRRGDGIVLPGSRLRLQRPRPLRHEGEHLRRGLPRAAARRELGAYRPRAGRQQGGHLDDRRHGLSGKTQTLIFSLNPSTSTSLITPPFLPLSLFLPLSHTILGVLHHRFEGQKS